MIVQTLPDCETAPPSVAVTEKLPCAVFALSSGSSTALCVCTADAALPAALALLALCVARPRLARRPDFAWTVLALVLAWGVARNLLGM